jgi:hypothetical protein
VIVHPPGIDLALIIDIKGVVVSAEDIFGSPRMHLLNSERLLVLIPSIKHPSNLATFWVAPSLHLSITSQHQGMVGATCYLNYPYFARCFELTLGQSGGNLYGVVCLAS